MIRFKRDLIFYSTVYKKIVPKLSKFTFRKKIKCLSCNSLNGFSKCINYLTIITDVY
jgi:hypothetical protein